MGYYSSTLSYLKRNFSCLSHVPVYSFVIIVTQKLDTFNYSSAAINRQSVESWDWCYWRRPPVKPGVTGEHCRCAPALVAPGITGGPIRGHEICCNQSEFPVRLADIAGAHRRCRTNPNFPWTVNIYILAVSNKWCPRSG